VRVDKVEPTTKFFDDLNLTPSGWAKVSGATVVDAKASHCDVEVRCGMSRVSPVDRDALAPLKVAYFDIETISASMEFPEASNAGDCKTQRASGENRGASSSCCHSSMYPLATALFTNIASGQRT
tara:strand:- start:942 stop:1316 length:375 start_codon:yes stop_codon:yes gene_type:complete